MCALVPVFHVSAKYYSRDTRAETSQTKGAKCAIMWQGFKSSGGWKRQQWKEICPICCKLDDVIRILLVKEWQLCLHAQSSPVCIILQQWTISKVTSKWLQGAVFVKRLAGTSRISWKAKFHYCSPKSLTLVDVSILSLTSPVHSLPL